MSGQSVMVLGIAVDTELVDRWPGWLMPDEQPFLVLKDLADAIGLVDDRERLSPELRDSFSLYGIGDRVLCWLTRAESRRLPGEIRSAQPASHRWPSLNPAHDLARVMRFVEEGVRPSRHAEVAEATWQTAAPILPAARDLAGTFPLSSGPNCFGTVMGAAGAQGAAATWVQREPFEAWLMGASRPGGPGGEDDNLAGTVLVWRDAAAEVQHAAVTLGDGWAIHKPSQGWMSPTMVLTVRDTILSSRTPGHYLYRRRLLGPLELTR